MRACDRRIPPHIRYELRLAFRIEDPAVSLFEERPAFRDRSRWIEIPVAKFRYYNGLKEWRLFWRTFPSLSGTSVARAQPSTTSFSSM